ncbi:hypothetical protein ABPG72_018328 [Tetrahymena utriculariae]
MNNQAEVNQTSQQSQFETKVQTKDTQKVEKVIEIKPEIKFYEKLIIKVLKQGHIPNHVAFIMDGNRRFATNQGKQKTEGHFSGFVTFKKCCEWCFHLGVKEMTVFAFAIENFNRSKEEVEVLMNLAQKSLRKLANNGEFLQRYNIKVKVCGDLKLLPQEVQQSMNEIEELTKNNKSQLLNICFAYNSQNEIEHSVSQIKKQVEDKKLDVSKIDNKIIMENMHVKTCPDILIRTSNENRLSNFLTYQSTNTQIIFIKENWPELSIFSILKIIIQYQLQLYKQKQVQKQIDSCN